MALILDAMGSATLPAVLSRAMPRIMIGAGMLHAGGQASGEKSMGERKTDSAFATSLPFDSDSAFALIHPWSAWKAAHEASAVARLWWTGVLRLLPHVNTSGKVDSLPQLRTSAKITG